jgi:hypothetical protein
VQQTFHPDDVPENLAIPPAQDMVDFPSCHFYSKGVFSVKSTYKVRVDNQTEKVRPSNGNTVHNPARMSEGGMCLWPDAAPDGPLVANGLRLVSSSKKT